LEKWNSIMGKVNIKALMEPNERLQLSTPETRSNNDTHLRNHIYSQLLTLTLTGCSNSTLSTTLTASQTVVSKTLSALSVLKSYNLDTDIKSYDNDSAILKDEWIGSKQVDITNHQMGMNMTTKDTEPGNILDLLSLTMYLQDGEDYQADTAPGLSQPNPWSKTQLTDTLWNRETQIPYLTELFETSTQVNSLENETVNSIDCYVLTITPSAQAAVDFVVSQGRGPIVLPENTHHQSSLASSQIKTTGDFFSFALSII